MTTHTGRGPNPNPLPKGTVPLPEGVPERRNERFERLRAAIETRENALCLGHDQTRPGGADPNGRFAVLAQEPDDGRLELTRCSSLVRAEQIAVHQVTEGWAVVCAYDLDTLSKNPVTEPEEPMPVRHDVAAQRIIVVFNTVAS